MSEREALWKEGFIEISNVKTELYGLTRRLGTTLLEWTLDVTNTFNLKFWDCKKQADLSLTPPGNSVLLTSSGSA